MEADKLVIVMEEAWRFIKVARAAEKRLKEDNDASFMGSPETAACRRASMDLTRALADLRR